jgi:hypothetical protein
MQSIKKFDMHSRKPSLFLFGLGGKWGRIFLSPLYVLKKFPSRSQRIHKVPNVFSRSSNNTTLLSHMFAQTCPLLISIDGLNARNSIFLYCEYDFYVKEPPKFH